MMTGKERVTKAVTFGSPDRIPLFIYSLTAGLLKYGEALTEILGRQPDDFGGGGFVSPTDDGQGIEQVGTFTDSWGSVWENTTPGIVGQVKQFPLGDYSNFATYRPPYDLLGKGFEKVDETIEQERDRFIIGHFCRLFERMQFLRSTEKLMLDLMDDVPEVYRLRDMVHEYNMRDLEYWVRHDFDCICFSDDWGSQGQLLIPPWVWRRFFKPCYKEMFDLVKSKGMLIKFHSDGYILEIIEDLIELGVDALNAQVWCMDMDELSRRFRGRICFWGGMDRQHILRGATPAQVRAACQKMIDLFDTPAGGFVGQAEVGPDCPLANVEALMDGWLDYRRVI